MGINPVAFNGATAAPVCYQRCGNGCPELWSQSYWINNGRFLSRDELAQLIRDAERDITNFLGVPLCPELMCKTFRFNPDCMIHHARDRFDLHSHHLYWEDHHWDRRGPRFQKPSYDLGDCPVWILPRLRQEVVCTACRSDSSMRILDQNGNTFVHDGLHCPVTVRLTCTVPGEVKECEVSVYYSGKKLTRDWQVRDLREVASVYNSTADTTAITIDIDPWKCIDASLWTKVHINDPENCDNEVAGAISLLDINNYADCLDIVRTYPDESLPLVEFIWEPKGGCGCGQATCGICTPMVCPGCIVQNTRTLPQFVTVAPATWDAAKKQWCVPTATANECWGCGRGDPDAVRIYYWYGFVPSAQCPITSICEIDCSELERLIAILAAARINRPVCECACERTSRWEGWTRDKTYSTRESGSYFLTQNIVENPLGTKIGEIEVFNRLQLIKSQLCDGFVTSTGI